MNRLKELRADKTQRHMATVFGVSQSTWSSWESGRTKPPLSVMQRLEEMFSLKKEHIFFGLFDYKM